MTFGNFNRGSSEASIAWTDLPWLIGAILTGGVVAPIILMFSLRDTPAATASLLLNFEGVATTLVAVLIFKEAIGRRIWLAIGIITAASIMLTWNPIGQRSFSLSAFGVLSACIFWGLDNNFTRNISAKDPLVITIIKGLCAGTFSLILALILKNSLPNPLIVVKAMLLGSISYGASIVLFIIALRNLGAARTGSFFAAAPFIGAVLSFLVFREIPNLRLLIAFVIMILGIILLFKENHGHQHTHLKIEHEHSHRHDDGHHLHPHDNEEICATIVHSHLHLHQSLEHTHDHTPDIHHRHRHK